MMQYRLDPSFPLPVVTVAIPTRNRAHLVLQAIESVLAQELHDIEVLVSDNASTDGTPELLQQLSDPRVRVLTHDTLVPMAAHWNSLLSRSRGEFFVLLSDDDYLDAAFLSKLSVLLRQYPSAPFAFGKVIVHEAATTYGYRPGPEVQNGEEIVVDCLCGRRNVHLCGILFRAAALRESGGFPEQFSLAADSAAWFPLAIGRSLPYSDAAVAHYRLTESSITSRSDYDARKWLHERRELVAMCLSGPIASRLSRREAVRFRRIAHRTMFRGLVGIVVRARRKGHSRLASLRLLQFAPPAILRDVLWCAPRVIAVMLPRKVMGALTALYRPRRQAAR